jgi:hypothetical protein
LDSRTKEALMQDIMKQMLEIIENAKGNQDVLEAEMKEYYEANKKAIEDASKRFQKYMEDMYKKIPTPTELFSMMQENLELFQKMVGEENFRKLMAMQQQYPFIQEITSKIFGNKK